MTEQQLDRKDLKIQALLERISALTSDYENKDAERRVEYTLLQSQTESLYNQVQELSAQLQPTEVESVPQEQDDPEA